MHRPWVLYATSRGWPVSTSQSTVGGLLGVGLTAEAINTGNASDLAKGVQFAKVGGIAQSWVNSPLAGGGASVAIYTIARPLYKYTQFIPRINYLWRGAIVVTGGMVAYGLGRNDTGNFIGPLAGGLDAAKRGEDGQIGKTADVNQGMRVLGGLVILIGMHNFSRSVTSTIGSGIMELNMAKAVSAQLGTALVVDYYSDQKKPISTSHTIMGSVFGLALASAAEKMPWRFVGQIGRAWLLSIPVSGAVAGGAYTGYMSVASIDRDAAPIQDGNVNEYEQSGVSLLRTNRLVKDAAISGIFHIGATGSTRLARAGKLLGHTPVAPLGLFLAGMAVTEAADNGINRSFAETSKMMVEVIPIVGGAVQALDGAYALSNDKSWWTGLSVNENAAWGNIGAGSAWLAIDILAARMIGQVAIQMRDNYILDQELITSDTSPNKIIRSGFVGRIRDAMKKSSEKQDALEAEREDINQFRKNTMHEAFRFVARETQTNWLSQRLIQSGVEAQLDKADSMALKRLAVDNMHVKLAEHISRFIIPDANATPEEIKNNAEAQNAALYALGEVYLEAYNKGRPVFLERSARKALRAAGIKLTTVNALIKATEKELPKGAALLTSRNTIERRNWERMINVAAERAVKRYSSWQRYPRMAGRILAEPLTLGTTFRFLGDGFNFIRPHLKPVGDAATRLARGWWNTVNPLRVIQVIKSDRAMEAHESKHTSNTAASTIETKVFAEIIRTKKSARGLSENEKAELSIEAAKDWNSLSKLEQKVILGDNPAIERGETNVGLARWVNDRLSKSGRKRGGYLGSKEDRIEEKKDRSRRNRKPIERKQSAKEEPIVDPKDAARKVK